MFLGKIWKWKRKGKILYWKEDCSKVFEQSPRKTHHLLFFNVEDEQKVDWKSVEIWRHCAEQEDCWNQRRKARTGIMCRYILVPVCKWFTAEWGKPRYKKNYKSPTMKCMNYGMNYSYNQIKQKRITQHGCLNVMYHGESWWNVFGYDSETACAEYRGCCLKGQVYSISKLFK